MKGGIIFLLIVIFIYAPTSLYSKIREVSLDECIQIALENHSKIREADEDIRKAIANYDIAQSWNRLLVNLELKTVESVKTEDELVIDDGSNNDKLFHFPPEDYQVGLYAGPTFKYNLFDQQKSEMVNSARSSVDLSKMEIVKVRESIICNVKINYYGYLFARENRKLREEMVDKFRIKLQKAKLLFKTGQRPILDVTKADVDLADGLLEYEKAKNNESMVKNELLASMGIMDEEIEFSPIKVERLPELRFALKELNRLAEDYYPDLRIAKMIKEINRIKITVARKAHSPSIDLIGSLGYLNRNIIDNDSIESWNNMRENLKNGWQITTQVGLQAKLPLLSGGAINAKINYAIAEYNKSKYLEREILVRMRAIIRNYYQSMNEFKKQIEISKLIKDNAEKHLMMAQKSYENGIGSQLDMQDAEMAVLKAELSFLKARYDYLMTLAKLSNVVGLSEEYICLN